MILRTDSLLFPFPNGRFTDPTLCIRICVAIQQVAVCPLAKACSSAPPPNRSLEPRPNIQQKLNSLLPMASCQSFCGPYFLKAQGYLHQNNRSSAILLLKKNGCKSSSKRTKHIHLRFYFITNCINMKDPLVKYCPTEEMVGDLVTKAPKGKLFYKF